MKIVVIGGTGLIGSKLVDLLQKRGADAFAAAPGTGVNTLTGEGLAKALAGEIAGPEAIPLDELARELLSAREDGRDVVADARVRYFGAALNDQSLIPGPNARLGALTFGDWLRQAITPD